MSQKHPKNQNNDTNEAPHILLLQPEQQLSQWVVNLVHRAVALEFPNATIDTIDALQYVYKPLPEIITDAVEKADLIIGNMDGGNVSVTFGLGVAVSKSKPILLIAPAGRALSVPTDFFKARLHIFSFDEPDLFVANFGYQVKDALKRETDDSPKPENDIFISYCHTDNEFLQRLLIHLRPLNKAGLIKTWADTDLRAGDLWEQEITKALQRASAAILLVSADFMASDFIVDNELPPLLAKAEAEGTRIIPLIVKPCRFTRDKHISRFQAVNEPRRPLISLTEAEKEEIYDKVAMFVEGTLRK
jgi:hypothetical protein